MSRRSRRRHFFKDNGLSLCLFGLFLSTWVGQALTGWRHENQERQEHHQAATDLGQYLRSGAFLEATFENWESEFLQMAAFLVLSAVLVQRGAAESKKGSHDEHDADPRRHRTARSPGPVHRGGLALKVYSHSLSLSLGVLFVICFVLHAISGRANHNEEQAQHGKPGISVLEYVGSSTFWFESLQNWQSEFMSVGALIVLSIFLREKGSPESKPVAAPHAKTGTD